MSHFKKCADCGEDLPQTSFAKSKKYTDGYHYRCRPCENLYTKEWRFNNKEKSSYFVWRSNIKRNFGITAEQYKEMFDRQEGKCAICEKHQDILKRRLAVDHNHFTGEIRGLLCTYCNHRVVGRHRDGNLLRKIADYVDAGTGWFVPKKKKTVKRKSV